MEASKPKPKKRNILRRLRTLGFDESRYDREDRTHRVKCSQCEALCINGVPCHETGCPNQNKHQDDDCE